MLYKAKVVGRSFHKLKNEVEDGDYLIIVEDKNNKFDSDAVAVYNGEKELVGFLANSDSTLSENNVLNGNLPSSVIKQVLDFSNREYFVEVLHAYKSCIYVLINDGKWSSI